MEKEIYGYIIQITNVKQVDQVLKILCESQIYNLYSYGSRKPESKNKKFIKLGWHINCSIFESPIKDKLSRLKKIYDANKITYPIYSANLYYLKLLKLLSQFDKNPTFSYKIIKNYETIDHKNQIQEWWVWTLAQIIKYLGHVPITDECSDCGNANENYFSFELQGGGLKCKRHAFSKIKHQSNEEIKQYILLFTLDFKEFFKKSNDLIIDKQERILSEFINLHMGFYL